MCKINKIQKENSLNLLPNKNIFKVKKVTKKVLKKQSLKKGSLKKKIKKLKVPSFNRNKNNKRHKYIKNKKFYKKSKNLSLYNKKLYSFNSYKLFINEIFDNKIVFRVKGNNFFCTFLDLKKNKILQADSAGKYKLKTSKKNIKFNLPIVLSTFMKRLEKNNFIYFQNKEEKSKKSYFFSNMIVKVIAKLRIRRTIFNRFFYSSRGTRMFYLQPKKCFNGCRAVKARRKKRLRFRIFK